MRITCVWFILILSFLSLAFPAQATENSPKKEFVANVLNFKATPGDKHTTLSWVNPESSDFDGVKIQRSQESYPSTPVSGETVYQGRESFFIDLNLVNNQTYYYTLFAHDRSGNYSSGAIALAKPTVASLAKPYQETDPLSDWTITTPPAPETVAKKEKIESSDFSYYLLLDKKPLEIGLGDLRELRVVKDSTLLIEIAAGIFAHPVKVITVSTAESSYLMKLSSDLNKYQVVISAPAAKGDYELRLVIVYENNSLSDLKTKFLVDPQGYVYEMGSSFFGLGKKQEMRIEGAEITIFQRTSTGFEKWPAEKYYQKNPVYTSKSGEYAFFVPDGEYYLEIKKAGYRTQRTGPFEVKGRILNKNVEIRPQIGLWLWFLAVVSFLVLIAFVFYLRKKLKSSRINRE